MGLLSSVPHLLMGHVDRDSTGKTVPAYFLQTQPEWLKEPVRPHPQNYGVTDGGYLFGLLELLLQEEMKDVVFQGLSHPIRNHGRSNEEAPVSEFAYSHLGLPWIATFDGFGRPHIRQRLYGDRFLTIYADTAFMRKGHRDRGPLESQFVRTINAHGEIAWAVVTERRLTHVPLSEGQLPTDRVHIYATLGRLLLAALPRLRHESDNPLPEVLYDFWNDPKGTWLDIGSRYTEEYSITLAGVAPHPKELELYERYATLRPKELTMEAAETIVTVAREVYANEQGAEETHKALKEEHFYAYNGSIPPPGKPLND